MNIFDHNSDRSRSPGLVRKGTTLANSPHRNDSTWVYREYRLFLCSAKDRLPTPQRHFAERHAIVHCAFLPFPSRVDNRTRPSRVVYIPARLWLWHRIGGSPSWPYRGVLSQPGCCSIRGAAKETDGVVRLGECRNHSVRGCFLHCACSRLREGGTLQVARAGVDDALESTQDRGVRHLFRDTRNSSIRSRCIRNTRVWTTSILISDFAWTAAVLCAACRVSAT